VSLTAPHRCWCRDQTSAEPAGQGSQGRKLSDRQKLALDAITSRAADQGVPPAATFELPQGLLTLTIDQWRDELLRRGVIAPDHKNPREASGRSAIAWKPAGSSPERDGLVWKTAN
jgi:hypothetical protein